VSFLLRWWLAGRAITVAAALCWGGWLVTGGIQLGMSWLQKAYTGPVPDLRTAVIIPCYNEDPAFLAAVLDSLRAQTHPADDVIVCDDGSDVSYEAVRARYPEVTWIRQDNAGKKHAQAAALALAPAADIFVTIDSDSMLARNAIEEALRPFGDPWVQAVTGIEMAPNWNRNLLTRTQNARAVSFQLLAMASQSVAGSVLICPGAFSMYRADLVRAILPAYLGETFAGVPVTLGDDTALTFFALMAGRVVQQPTAFSFPVYPERLSHHLRQWLRWMRASTVRTVWQLRYLPVASFAWLVTLWQLAAFTAGMAVTAMIPLTWPESEPLAIVMGAGIALWPLIISARMITIRRSDMTAWQTLGCIALMPLGALWYLLVLRQIRFWGIATCTRQNWVTRENGPEVRVHPQETP
jgi:hyaluronan synthase